MNLKKKVFVSLLFSSITIFPLPLYAQTDQQIVEEPKVTATFKDKLTMTSDASRMPGEISLNQSDFKLDYDYKAFGVLPVSVGFLYRHLDLSDKNIPVPLPSHLEGRELSLGAKFPLPFVESNVYFMGVDIMPSWFSDDWSWENSAFRLPFRTYVIYKPSDTFLFVLGATVNVNADTPVTPIIGFNYKPDEHWDFHLASSDPSISYKINEAWAIFAEYGALLDEYEVNRAGQKGVVFKVREASFGGGLKYTVAEWLEASLSSGASMGRRFAYRDGVGKVDVDGAPYLKARLSVKF